MPHLERHLFVCTNRREPGNPKGSCADKNSDALRDYFKRELAVRGKKSLMRANAAGCLDQCEHGPVLVVYPEQVWYTCPTVADAKEILESHLIGGVPVERLIIK